MIARDERLIELDATERDALGRVARNEPGHLLELLAGPVAGTDDR